MTRVKAKFKVGPLLKSILNKTNSFCKSYQHLIQAIGILVGLYLLFLTYVSINISNEQLRLSKQQEYQKQLPMWQFDIADSLSVARLRPFSQDVKLEEATAYFPDLYFKKDNEFFIDQPNFELHLTIFKDYVEKLVSANYSDSIVSVGIRSHFPIGIKMSYVQFGELRTVEAVFAIHFLWIRFSESSIKIQVQGIKFVKYIIPGEKLMPVLNKFSRDDLRDVKHPKVY